MLQKLNKFSKDNIQIKWKQGNKETSDEPVIEYNQEI